MTLYSSRSECVTARMCLRPKCELIGIKSRLAEYEDRKPATFLPSTDRKSTRLNSSHDQISYAVFCLKKKKVANAHPRDRQGVADSQLGEHAGHGIAGQGPAVGVEAGVDIRLPGRTGTNDGAAATDA